MGPYGGASWAWGHGGPWMFGPFLGLIWIGLIAVGVYLLLRYLRDRDELPDHGRISRAKHILDERYARGELSTEEYKERIENLR